MIKDLNEGPNKNGFVRSRGGENRRWGLPGELLREVELYPEL